MDDTVNPPIPALAASADEAALQQALEALFEPLAELAIARGVPCPTAEELLRRAYVQAANKAHSQLPAHRRVSRIATSTGLSRREVSRLTSPPPADGPAEAPRRPVANELFARWLSDPQYRDGQGQPLTLPQHGQPPSFESLAQSVTKDVHPRSLLEEVARLKMVQVDPAQHTVSLMREAFVPRADQQRLLQLMADNTGDHLRAAVANVLGEGREHLEQAVFADELSSESLEQLKAVIGQEWKDLLARLVPLLERMIEEDARAQRPQDQRVRIGLYAFTTPMGETQ